jgi:hypothetical protein
MKPNSELNTIPPKQETKLPTIAQLFEGVEEAPQMEALNIITNTPPPATWIKEHPYVKGHKYLPIDKVEYLLRKIFKSYKIEVLREGTAFNGVYVVVRIHYLNPVTGQMEYHDGIGATELQLRKRTEEEKEMNIKVPFNSDNINSGALSMALPIAKTLAIKDACHHFGKIFGSDLNRKDVLEFKPDMEIIDRLEKRKQLVNGVK